MTDLPNVSDHEVIRFEISMNDTQLMKGIHHAADLSTVVEQHGLRERGLLTLTSVH